MSLSSGAAETLLASAAGAEAEFARRVQSGGLGSFVNFAMQNRSRSARGVLMRAASDGVLGLDELDALTQSVTVDDASRALAVDVVRTLEPKPLLALAGMMANQRLGAHDVHRASALYSMVLEAHGGKIFGRLDRKVFLELLSDQGLGPQFDAAFTEVPLSHGDWRQAVLMVANLVNPWEQPQTPQGDAEMWRRFTSSIFNAEAVEPIDVTPAAGLPFDSILCSSTHAAAFGPKVSVLVPTRNPGPRIGTALASLLNQTWQNLEVLVLDDGSDREHRYFMDAWAERDARIQVLRMRGNTGNYAARNVGLERAVGEFLTVHDDDDWSHPRKLETQALALMEAPEVVANMSQLIRATDSLRFTRINSNPDFIQPNYSSLMFRRAPVLSGIGYWNEANRAADAEFRDRLTAWSGAAPAVAGQAPMSFLRVRKGSLTSGEIQRGYIDPRRRWYQMSTEGWRTDVMAKGESLYIPKADPDPKFSVPVSMLGPGSAARIRFDVVYATDFRFPGGNTSVSVNEIETLMSNGYRVAVMQLDSPVLGSTKHLSQAIRRLSLDSRCSVVTLLDNVDCDVLVVRHPTVMQFLDRQRSPISARTAVLIVNHAPMLRDGSSTHYDLPTCIRNFTFVFGQSPVVAPESGVIRECLGGLLDGASFTEFDWNGMLSGDETPARSADPSRAPVIGRHSRDNSEKWPTEPANLEAVYPIDGSRDVRILGGADIPLARLTDRDVRGWTVHPFGSMPPLDFLRQIDFWVYFHAEHLIESFGMATAEAMASGAVVILPHYMRSTFGSGAIYCKPDEVQHIVDETWSNPDAYRRQSAAGIAVARSEFTVHRFLERIEGLRQH